MTIRLPVGMIRGQKGDKTMYTANTTTCAPRCSALRKRGFRAAIQGLLRPQPHFVRRFPAPRHAAPSWMDAPLERLRAVYQWVNIQLDKEMTGAGYFLCGAILGLIAGPLLFFCYFG